MPPPLRLSRRALLVSLGLFASRAGAQAPPRYLAEPAEVRVVGAARPGEALPLLVVLPPTGGSARWFYEALAPALPWRAYVVVLPAGEPTRADYADFERFTRSYLARVDAEVARAQSQHPVDPRQRYLAGFSLGGDLAWAFLGREPAVWRGALVLSSRCGAAMPAASLAALRAREARVLFAIGDGDRERLGGLQRAYGLTQRGGVAAQRVLYPGGHEPPQDPRLLAPALRSLAGL